MAANRLKSRDQCDDSMTTDTLTENGGKNRGCVHFWEVRKVFGPEKPFANKCKTRSTKLLF